MYQIITLRFINSPFRTHYLAQVHICMYRCVCESRDCQILEILNRLILAHHFYFVFKIQILLEMQTDLFELILACSYFNNHIH